ncbi:MAG: FadR family transcriptional regulator [Rhodomicrobium sp.]|nr:FadR family transcriptional regulator [Rhodomicrobium sp.]
MSVQNSFDLTRELLRIIRSGEWSSGRLPPERVLAERFSVARNTLRRALDALETDGYLIRHVGRGTFIRARRNGAGEDALFRVSEASPRDLLETRLIIEPHAAALAATRASRADLDAIADALAQSLAAREIAEFERWDAQLHLAIFLAAKNEVLINYCRAIGEARNQRQWFELKKRSLTPDKRAVYDRQHRGIVEGLMDRNAEAAAETMRLHLKTVEDSILSVI